MRLPWLLICLLAALASGCQVGPDFVPPTRPSVADYTITRTSNLTAGRDEPAQKLIVGEAIPESWWQLFRSDSLDSLVRQVIAGSPTIEAARAKLAAAHQAVLVAQGGLYPQVDASALAMREKGPPFAFGLLYPRQVPTYNLYSVGPIASFTPDVFGLTSRLIEEQSALAELQADQLAAAQLTTTGNAVSEVLAIATLRMQKEAAASVVSDDEKYLALTQQLYEAGKVNRSVLMVAKVQLENDRTSLPPLDQQIAAAEDALAVLIGKAPAEWAPPAFSLDEFTLPADLPVSIPSALVRQRPDIRAAEAELQARSAAIGVATGQLYPIITLSAALDPTALSTGALFQGSNLAWNIISSITVPIFHGGALEAQKQASVDAFQAALSQYKETVLQGLGQVADILHALDHDAVLVHSARDALDASEALLELQRLSYAAGKTDRLHLLASERNYQQVRTSYARARGQRYLDTAQLLVALGGGWGDEEVGKQSMLRKAP